ncbi:MAG: DUF2786 domain-containing protein [Gemmatimonadota bacterium]
MSRAGHIRAELLEAWNRKLYAWWSFYNDEFLGGALRPPLIELSQADERLGQWDPQQRRLAISARHVEADPWPSVMDTLRHEMAHQYAGEVLRAAGESPHDGAFRQACERLRCVPRARVQPGADAAEDERLLRVLKKVLSLTDSPNEHEAQAAVSKARRLLLEYNLDLVELDRERQFEARTLGPVKGRRASWELWLAMILNQYFFVEVLWARAYDARRDRDGSVPRVYGTAANLDMAAYVYDYLCGLLPRLWTTYRRQAGLPGNGERLRYWAGVVQGFHAKLGEQENRLAHGTRALVWKGDARLRAFYRYHNPRVETRSTSGVRASAAYRAGVDEGRRVSIRRPVSQSAGRCGGLLTGG